MRFNLLPLLRIRATLLIAVLELASVETKQGSNNKGHFSLTDDIYCSNIFKSTEKREELSSVPAGSQSNIQVCISVALYSITVTGHTTQIQRGSELGLNVVGQ